MSEHRILCPAEAPDILAALAHRIQGHRHACKHDLFRPDSPVIGLIEHECECGVTWILRPEPT